MDAPAQLAFARVNPLEHGEEIKDLFLAHERPEFPAFFDRTYPDVVKEGGGSWVGRDRGGRICAHIAQFPRQFRLGPQIVRASLLGNLMVAKAYRTLWPALTLVRRLVSECKQSGSFDFLYGDPNDAAMAVTKMAGFRRVGALWRFVAPVSDRRGAVDLGIGFYQLLRRLRVPASDFDVRVHQAIDLPSGPAVVEVPDPVALRPVPKPAVYRHRLPGYPSTGDRWYAFHRRSAPEPVAAVLLRSPDDRGLAVMGALQCASLALLAPVLLTLTRTLRSAGIERVEMSVMGESRAAEAVQRAGFVAREERIPVMAIPLTDLGADALEVGTEWRVLPVDLDR